jgi:signal transduction histidine kinase
MKLISLLKALFVICALSLAASGVGHAAETGTAAEAEAMTKRAVTYLKANGPEKASQEFTHGSAFKDRDLYVSYYDMTGKVLGHGANAKLVGKDLSGLKDPKGKLFIQMITDVAKTKGKGWTDTYTFRNPVTDKMAEKIIYVERVDDSWVGVGIYK